jgi:hypothetical protein
MEAFEASASVSKDLQTRALEKACPGELKTWASHS